MDGDALQWVKDHTEPFKEIIDSDSDSMLVACPVSVGIKSLENFQATPNRIERSVSLSSVDSFCDYVNRFKKDHTSVYMHTSRNNGGDSGFVALLDHYGRSSPSWCDHTALHIPERSIEWRAWTGIHGKSLTQLELASFIEDNLSDIYEPDSNVMLQAALAFESNEDMTLASSMNLDNGATEFRFTKGNKVSDVQFPHRITLRIPVFENDKPKTIAARVRYKTSSDGVLTFKIWLVDNGGRIERDVMMELSAHIIGKVSDVIIYEGKPDGGYRAGR
jgi:uncharacterized protein YfdQ (DUF2303 family)